MNKGIRFIVFAVCSYLMLVSTNYCAYGQNERITIRNDEYRYSIIRKDSTDIFYIDGWDPVKSEEVRLPSRTYIIPCPDSYYLSYKIENIIMGASFIATPFYRVAYDAKNDSIMISEIIPVEKNAVINNNISDSDILSQKYIKRGNTLFLAIELPLLRYDAECNTCQWIEGYELVVDNSVSASAAMKNIAEEYPYYSSMPFIRRSHDLDTSGAWIDYSNQSVLFHIRKDGLYRLSKSWFERVGVQTIGINTDEVTLYRKGKEVPMYAVGMEDGSFDEGDYFIFFGQMNYDEGGYRKVLNFSERDEPYPQYLNKYTDAIAYWLNYDKSKGLRIKDSKYEGTAPVDTLDWAVELIHTETDAYLQSISTDVVRQQNSDWTSEDTWHMGWIFNNSSRNYSFRVDNMKPGIPTKVWYKINAWYTSSPGAPYFKVSMRVNSSQNIDSTFFENRAQALLQGNVSFTDMREGNNTITLKNEPLQSGSYDIVVDWYDVEYPRYLKARNYKHIFTVHNEMGEGNRVIRIDEMNTGNIFILKETDNEIVRLTNYEISTGNTIALHFADTIREGSRYAISSMENIEEPSQGISYRVTDLRSNSLQANYVIINNRAYEQEAREYARYIENEYGIIAKNVNVEDIYDNYSYGSFNPEAIKIFLYDAYKRWNDRKINYVFLAGDANYNYKHTAGLYSKNYVPSYGFPVSDTWFVAFDSLSLEPVISIGRIPVTSGSELLAYRDKHIKYRAMKPDIWNKTALCFSGGFPSDGEAKLLYYRSINDDLIKQILMPAPFAGQSFHFYKTINPQTDFGPYSAEYIKEKFDEGGIFISYIGHSGTATWDNSIEDPSKIANARDRSSVISDFGCSTAKFAEPDILSMSEAFVVPVKSQAIAYVGNSSLGFESNSQRIPNLFYGSIVRKGKTVIGDAHRDMKMTLLANYGSSTINSIALRTNTLIGDPIVRIALPDKPNLTIKPENIRLEQDFITDAMDSTIIRIVVSNYGLWINDSVDVKIEEQNGGIMTYMNTYRIAIPYVYDTIRISVPTMQRSGMRKLICTVDPGNHIDEYDETDNSADYEYNVLSTYIKPVNYYRNEVKGEISGLSILNPMSNPGSVDDILFEFDEDKSFAMPISARTKYGKTISRLEEIPSALGTSKIYWRAKLDIPNQDYIGPYGFWNRPGYYGFIQYDSVDFNSNDLLNVAHTQKGIMLKPLQKHLKVTSSGYLDGNYGAVDIDGKNVLPTSFFIAYAVVVLDSVTLNVKKTRIFDTYNSSAQADSLVKMIYDVQFGEIVAISTADEPRTRSTAFIDPMRSIGSKYIDSVAYGTRNCSWSIIGRKGAAIGTVPEAVRQVYQGKAIVDTTYTVPPDTGYVISQEIGPAAAWRSIRLDRSVINESEINLTLFGKTLEGNENLLREYANPDTVDISTIDGAKYPFIKLKASIVPGSGLQEPFLRSWAVDYQKPPEIAMNYQSVFTSRDSIFQGEIQIVRIGVLNAGDANAEQIPVQIDLMGEDNIRKPIASYSILNLDKRAWHDTTININTKILSGKQRIFVTLDNNNVVYEQYETNNIYMTGFYIIKDTSGPSLDVLFDGYKVFDGDYVRQSPEILITLFDPSTSFVTDAKNFVLMHNDSTLLPEGKEFVFIPASPESNAVLRYIPDPPLEGGEHIFKFNARDAYGNIVYKDPLQILVKVNTTNSISQLFNYPNPVQRETAFTYILSGLYPPDKVELKIYTTNGRLVKTISGEEKPRIGHNTIQWNGMDSDGNELANGVYFYKIIIQYKGESVEAISKIAVMK